MDPNWVFAYNSNEIPEWARHHLPAAEARTEVRNLKTLEVEVVMCCGGCVEKVEEAVRGMHGVLEVRIDRWKDRVSVVETPGGGLDKRLLVKKLKRATHDRKVRILESKSTEESRPSTSATSTTVVYRNPAAAPGYNHLMPWPASSASPSFSPVIANPYYLQYPVGCGNCARYPGAVCANCGRGSELGARFL